MRRLLTWMVVVLLAAPAWGGKVETFEAMERQAEKFGAPSLTEAATATKRFCLCHFQASSGSIGIVFHVTTFGPGLKRKLLNCAIPTYSTVGELMSVETCLDSGGTSWEVLK